jgi:hypothetical protein
MPLSSTEVLGLHTDLANGLVTLLFMSLRQDRVQRCPLQGGGPAKVLALRYTPRTVLPELSMRSYPVGPRFT